MRIVGRVYSCTRIKPPMLLCLVHNFYAGFGSDIWGWVLGNFAPQSMVYLFLSSDFQVSVLFTIGSVRVTSISLLMTGELNRIQIFVCCDTILWDGILVTIMPAKSFGSHRMLTCVSIQLRVVMFPFYLVSVWYLQLWHLIWPNQWSVWL